MKITGTLHSTFFDEVNLKLSDIELVEVAADRYISYSYLFELPITDTPTGG